MYPVDFCMKGTWKAFNPDIRKNFKEEGEKVFFYFCGK